MTKILFSDLDGTLIYGDHATPFTQKNFEKMEELRKQGHLVALCTGRNNIDIQPALKAVNIPYDYLVLCNGGYIVDSEGNVICSKLIKQNLACEMLKEFKKEEQLVTYYCDTKKQIVKNSEGIFMLDDSTELKKTDHWLDPSADVAIIGINQEDRQVDFLEPYASHVLKKYENDISWFYNTCFIDIMAKNISKGDGVKDLCQYLNITLENAYVIGDSFNDISMIQVAGHGYTFNRSVKEVKTYASHLVDYVYEVIDEMLK